MMVFAMAVVWCLMSPRDVLLLSRRLEARRIRRHVDSIALQRWAAVVLVAHSNDEALFYDPHTTNVPADVFALYPEAPNVGARRDSVVIHWGRAHPSIHVGATNFVLTSPVAMRWCPGVYLVLAE